jgi:hypothetical protein
MSTIRPDLPQSLPGATPSAQVRTAQAAFFRAALNAVQAAPPRDQTPAATRTATAPDDSPRQPRPGHLLDIRV